MCPTPAPSLIVAFHVIIRRQRLRGKISRIRAIASRDRNRLGIASPITTGQGVLFSSNRRSLEPNKVRKRDRKSTRLNPVTNAHLVCRILLEKKNNKRIDRN